VRNRTAAAVAVIIERMMPRGRRTFTPALKTKTRNRMMGRMMR